MGGFSSQVQTPQASRLTSGKTGSLFDTVREAVGNHVETATPAPAESPKPLDGINNGYFAQAPRPMGKGGAQTNSATSGQPTMGAPNQYSNTVGQWDNTQQQTQQPMQGKGKGA